MGWLLVLIFFLFLKVLISASTPFQMKWIKVNHPLSLFLTSVIVSLTSRFQRQRIIILASQCLLGLDPLVSSMFQVKLKKKKNPQQMQFSECNWKHPPLCDSRVPTLEGLWQLVWTAQLFLELAPSRDGLGTLMFSFISNSSAGIYSHSGRCLLCTLGIRGKLRSPSCECLSPPNMIL